MMTYQISNPVSGTYEAEDARDAVSASRADRVLDKDES